MLPLEGSLARTISLAFKTLFLDAMLSRDVPVISPDSADRMPSTIATYESKSIVVAYGDYYKANGLVDTKDRKVLFLATLLSVYPGPEDRVTIGGSCSRCKTYPRIIRRVLLDMKCSNPNWHY